jgi:hypothetical protein
MIIKQSATGLNSRSEVNYYDKNNKLPLFTAPMTTVVNTSNIEDYLKLDINVCMPRTMSNYIEDPHVFNSMSLSDFEDTYLKDKKFLSFRMSNYGFDKVCIDTANGNMPKLHEAIIKAKDIYGDKIIVMAGNIASLEAFDLLASTGCDYIRVGVGGGGACNTSRNTGVFNDNNNLIQLVEKCNHSRVSASTGQPDSSSFSNWFDEKQRENITKCKIVADGISSTVKQMQEQYGTYDNGYATINSLLHSGADYVMIGTIFNKSLEAFLSGSKKTFPKDDIEKWLSGKLSLENVYRGMSTKEEQNLYSETSNKHSEGKTVYNTVKYTLEEWLRGSKRNPDMYPGFVNCLASAMSYTGSKTLNQFKKTNFKW